MDFISKYEAKSKVWHYINAQNKEDQKLTPLINRSKLNKTTVIKEDNETQISGYAMSKRDERVVRRNSVLRSDYKHCT